MCICDGCGKLIDSKFIYCPWCGYSRVEKEQEESMELRYKQFKQKQIEIRRNQLEQMEEKLNRLENELSVLVLSAQMAK